MSTSFQSNCPSCNHLVQFVTQDGVDDKIHLYHLGEYVPMARVHCTMVCPNCQAELGVRIVSCPMDEKQFKEWDEKRLANIHNPTFFRNNPMPVETHLFVGFISFK